MKKLLLVLTLALGACVFTGCSSKQKFYILNWGEYMDKELLNQFASENNVKIVYNELESNESMYASLYANNTAPYDIVFPSDYMVDKLYKENLIQDIDFTLLENYEGISMYSDGLDDIFRYDSNVSNYKNACVPYFWGSLGIMYNDRVDGLKEIVEEKNWDVLFDRTLTQDLKTGGLKIAMYASSRDSFAAAQLQLNTTLNPTTVDQLTAAANLLKGSSFDEWGTDDIKGKIAAGNLDLALVYSGDFFDQYYTHLDSDIDVNFGIHAPVNRNNIFFDAMCIPTVSKNVELAHKFIDFFLDHDNSLQNALAIGYAPTLESVRKAILEDPEMADVIAYPAYDPSLIQNGQVYQDLGDEIYKKMEDEYKLYKK